MDAPFPFRINEKGACVVAIDAGGSVSERLCHTLQRQPGKPGRKRHGSRKTGGDAVVGWLWDYGRLSFMWRADDTSTPLLAFAGLSEALYLGHVRHSTAT